MRDFYANCKHNVLKIALLEENGVLRSLLQKEQNYNSKIKLVISFWHILLNLGDSVFYTVGIKKGIKCREQMWVDHWTTNLEVSGSNLASANNLTTWPYTNGSLQASVFPSAIWEQ